MKRICATAWLLLFLSLAACVSEPRRDGFSPDGEETSSVIAPDRDTSAAVLELLGRARQASKSGQLHRAESLLERAIRIEPRNPVLWHYMAKVHLYRGRLDKAEGLAAKSNSLSGKNPALTADNWRIIAHARESRGDRKGALEAQQRAARVTGGS